MDLEKELKGRRWPELWRESPLEVPELQDYEKDPYVREGRIVLRPLGRKGITKPIPPEECAITSLVTSLDDRIFGATSGRRAHLFVYDPAPGADHVIDLGVLEEGCGVRRSLVASSDGRIFAGTRGEHPSSRAGGKLFCYTPMDDYSDLYGYRVGKIEVVATPVESDGIAALAIDNNRKRIYGISAPRGLFFVYDISSGGVEVNGAVDELGIFSDILIVGKDGCAYGAKRWGSLFKYDPECEEIVPLGVEIPSLRGRKRYNKVDSLALDEYSGRLYGGGSADGVLFYFDPQDEKMISLGKPVAQPRIRALTVGRDGIVYGIGGGVGGMGHLFRYDPEGGDLRDLGIPLATSQRYWHGYEFDAATTGPYGEIYLGESDRISHLFIYFPPIPERKRSTLKPPV